VPGEELRAPKDAQDREDVLSSAFVWLSDDDESERRIELIELRLIAFGFGGIAIYWCDDSCPMPLRDAVHRNSDDGAR